MHFPTYPSMAESSITYPVTSSDEVGNSETSKRKAIKSTAVFDSTFGTKTWREDAVLNVEGRRLYVSSSVLSLVSPVFTRMFEEKLYRNGPMEIELEGKTCEDFIEFLKCFYPNIMKMVTVDNVFVVLPLAMEFGVKNLVKSCEDLLVVNTYGKSTKAEDIFKYLSKAKEYKLTRLQRRCTEEACKLSYKDFIDAKKKCTIPSDVKAQIQNNLFESHEKVLKSVNLMELLFEEKTPSEMKNPRVGYLEYFFKMPNYSDRNSRLITVHAINWNINADTSDRKNIDIFFNAKPMKDRFGWKCQVDAIICLYNFKNEQTSVKRRLSGEYSSSSSAWGYSQFEDVETVTDTEAGFLQDGNMKVEVYFIVEEPTFDKG